MPKDLVVLVADKDIDYGLRGLLSRPRALGIRPITFDTYIHHRRDPACAVDSHNFLRPFLHSFRHAVVVFDRIGSGREVLSADNLSGEVRLALETNGWNGRAEVIVLDPELEIWVFSPSPHVEACLGWPRRLGGLRRWLEGQGLWAREDTKPNNSREALERALRKIGRPRSASLYQCLGRRVGLRACSDPALQKLRITLAEWFPPDR